MSGNNNGDNGDQPFFWWKGEDLADFFNTVSKYGYDNVRSEMHEEGEAEDREDFLYVIYECGLVGHYNESHTCPPDCG